MEREQSIYTRERRTSPFSLGQVVTTAAERFDGLWFYGAGQPAKSNGALTAGRLQPPRGANIGLLMARWVEIELGELATGVPAYHQRCCIC